MNRLFCDDTDRERITTRDDLIASALRHRLDTVVASTTIEGLNAGFDQVHAPTRMRVSVWHNALSRIWSNTYSQISAQGTVINEVPFYVFALVPKRDDELVEVTPETFRLRKKILNASQRKH